MNLFREQHELFDRLQFELAPRRARIILRGPSGAGKSHLLVCLEEHFRTNGKAVIIASGEKGATRPLQAFLRFIGSAAWRLGNKRFALQGAEAAVRTVPIVGSLAAFVTQAIGNDKTRTRRERLRYLRPDEFETLLHLEEIAGDGDLLLIADNLQYWDRDSSNLLLEILRDDAVAEDFPFIERTACILGITDGYEIDSVTKEVLNCADWREFRLNSIGKDEIGIAFLKFGGAASIPEKELNELMILTGGHLALIRQLAMHVDHSFGFQRRDVQGKRSQTRVLGEVMDQRIAAIGDRAEILRAVLNAASVIGESFSKSEIACLTKLDSSSLRRALISAQDLQILVSENDYHVFTHEILREVLLEALGGDQIDLHATLANCLSVIRPWDYRTRAEHLKRAGDEFTSAILYFADILQRKRLSRFVSDSDENVVLGKLSVFDLHRSANALLKALMLKGNEAHRVLESIRNEGPSYFVAEKELMLANLLMVSTRTEDRIRAVRILESALSLEHGEPELAVRIKLSLLSGYIHLERKDEARRIDLEIAQTLGKYRRFDPLCDNLLHVHYRKAATVWGAETAADRCNEAAQYFGADEANGKPRNPRQYFMALCNLSGNLLNCGRAEKALAAAVDAIAIYKRFPGSVSVRSTKCVNNLVVAGLLCGKILPTEGRSLLWDAVESSEDEQKSWIHRSNLSVLAALDGQLEQARAELQNAREEQERGKVFDRYHRYLISANLAGILHLQGNRDEGRRLWIELENEIPDVPDVDKLLWKARHSAQISAFDDVPFGNVGYWFNFPQLRRPKGVDVSAWEFFGRGFILSDSQIWTAS